jgi:hypothetical protein
MQRDNEVAIMSAVETGLHVGEIEIGITVIREGGMVMDDDDRYPA